MSTRYTPPRSGYTPPPADTTNIANPRDRERGMLFVTCPGATRIEIMDAYLDQIAGIDGAQHLSIRLPGGAYAVRVRFPTGEVEQTLVVQNCGERAIKIEADR